MKKEIKETEIKQFNHYGNIFTVLLLVCIITPVPLAIFLNVYGMIIYAILFIITFAFSLKVEK